MLPPPQLTDLSRLPEIYTLRVVCWEQSPSQPYANRVLFPQGWADALDTHPTARHWVVLDEGRIVIAARTVLLDSLAESGQPDWLRFALPGGRPYGYLSRLVIAQTYRKQGLAAAFDHVRMAWLRETRAAFGLAAGGLSKRLAALVALGWEVLGHTHLVVGVTSGSPEYQLLVWQPDTVQ